MATDTMLPENTQQFDDDEIVDNFGVPDDGVPMGLGGERGKQSEPASSTLEADMVAQPTKSEPKLPPGDDLVPPADTSADGEPAPVQDAAGDGDTGEPEPQTPAEPESPEFPAMLLQMAGFSTAEDAQKAGFREPEALLAAIQWRGQSLAQPSRPSRTSYLETKTPEAQPMQVPAEKPPQGDGLAFQPFKPANPDIFDEELLKLLDEQNKHFAAQYEQLASRLKSRDVEEQQRQQAEHVERFEQAVQGLGKVWEEDFGQGSGETLFSRTDAQSVMAAQRRLDLFDAVNLIRRTNAEQGGKPMTIEQEVQWALMQRYPDKFKQQLLRASQTKASGRRGVQASRPTARKTPLGTKNERLLTALQTKYPTVDFGPGNDEIEGDI